MNYTKSLGDKMHWVLKPESEWVLREVEAIVPEELWNQANAILEDHGKSRKPPAKRPVHLFAGVTYCACGGKMYVPSNTPKYVCQNCRNKIPIADLEAVFHEQLKNFFFSPEEVAEYLSTADDVIKGKEEMLRTLENEEEKVTKEMNRIMRLYLDDQIPQEAVGPQYRPLHERVKQLQDQIPTLQGELDFLKIQRLSSDEILSEARDLYTRWLTLGTDEKRHIVEQITEKITIAKEDIHIDLCYLPSASEMVAERPRNLTGSWPQPA